MYDVLCKNIHPIPLFLFTGAAKLPCEYCGKVLGSSDSLKQHITTQHLSEPTKCSYCERTFRSKAGLRDHELTHLNKNPRCDVCDKSFSNLQSLRDHLVVHVGKRNYKCPSCGKAYIHCRNLRRHMKCHSTAKQHPRRPVQYSPSGYPQCRICTREFANEYNLKRHNEKQPESACREYKEKLLSHQTSGQSQKEMEPRSEDFVCNICFCAFPTKKNLKSHKCRRRYTPPPFPLSCKLCNKNFRNPGNYVSHISQHGMYACLDCGEVCSSPQVLSDHANLRHPNVCAAELQSPNLKPPESCGSSAASPGDDDGDAIPTSTVSDDDVETSGQSLALQDEQDPQALVPHSGSNSDQRPSSHQDQDPSSPGQEARGKKRDSDGKLVREATPLCSKKREHQEKCDPVSDETRREREVKNGDKQEGTMQVEEAGPVAKSIAEAVKSRRQKRTRNRSKRQNQTDETPVKSAYGDRRDVHFQNEEQESPAKFRRASNSKKKSRKNTKSDRNPSGDSAVQHQGSANNASTGKAEAGKKNKNAKKRKDTDVGDNSSTNAQTVLENTQRFLCGDCNKEFTGSLDSHYCLQRGHVCARCKTRFGTSRDLRAHACAGHAKYDCSGCGAVFSTLQAVSIHRCPVDAALADSVEVKEEIADDSPTPCLPTPHVELGVLLSDYSSQNTLTENDSMTADSSTRSAQCDNSASNQEQNQRGTNDYTEKSANQPSGHAAAEMCVKTEPGTSDTSVAPSHVENPAKCRTTESQVAKAVGTVAPPVVLTPAQLQNLKRIVCMVVNRTTANNNAQKTSAVKSTQGLQMGNGNSDVIWSPTTDRARVSAQIQENALARSNSEQERGTNQELVQANASRNTPSFQAPQVCVTDTNVCSRQNAGNCVGAPNKTEPPSGCQGSTDRCSTQCSPLTQSTAEERRTVAMTSSPTTVSPRQQPPVTPNTSTTSASIGASPAHKCSQCDANFPSRVDLIVHTCCQQSYDFACPGCGVCFSSQEHRQLHICLDNEPSAATNTSEPHLVTNSQVLDNARIFKVSLISKSLNLAG